MGSLWVVSLAGCQGTNTTLTETASGRTVERPVSIVVIEEPSGPRLLVDDYDSGEPGIADSDGRTWIALELGALPEPGGSPIALPIDATLHYTQDHPFGGVWVPDGTWMLEGGDGHDARVRGIELYWGAFAEATPTYEAQLRGVVRLTAWDDTRIAGQLVVDVDGRLPYRRSGTSRVTLDFDVAR